MNYNTSKLGRGGVTSINLVASPEELVALKPKLEQLVASYEYTAGNKYSDFVEGRDQVAEISLIALIAGGVGAAAKTGALTKALLFIALAFKKLWIILIAGLGAFFKRLAGNNQSSGENQS